MRPVAAASEAEYKVEVEASVSQALQETGQGVCEHAAAGDNIPRAAVAQMVRDMITAFCPQY